MKLKFRTKIWMLPLCTAVIFMIGLAVSYLVGARTSQALKQLRTVDTPVLELTRGVDRGMEQFRLTLQTAAAEGDVDRLKDVQAAVDKTHEVLATMAKVPGQEAQAQELLAAFDAYQTAAFGATRAMLTKGDIGDLVPRMQAAQAKLEPMVKSREAAAQQATKDRQAEADQGVQNSVWVNLGTGLTVLAVLGLVSQGVVRSVWRELGHEPSELLSLTRDIAAGRLHVQARVSSGNDRSLHAGLVEMLTKLRETVGTIRLATDSISTASNEIAVGNQDLSARTENTASNLQATASSVVQLTNSVRSSAESARQANQMAAAAAEAAQRGGGIVSRAVDSMQEINAASRKIGEINGVIDGIAFQTNILALNAAVEAARAGEQGRGFAVVASEVRTLAQRSSQAAREIKALIVSSSEKVASGSQLVQDAGTAMQQILSDVRRVTDVIGEISAAATEQYNGIDQVNRSVGELDLMTQQNAALVEQSTAAASSMNDQARQLTFAVAAFELQEGSPVH